MEPVKMFKRKASEPDHIKARAWETWECEPSVFPWKYHGNEECLIMEGRAVITDQQGNALSISENDYVHFKKGLECEWKVIEKISKKYKIY
jgi:hypothetical protein